MIKNAEPILKEIEMIRTYRNEIIENDNDLNNAIKDIEANVKGEKYDSIGMLRDNRDVVEYKLNGSDIKGAEDVKFILINHIETIIEERVVEEFVDKLMNDVDDEKLEQSIIDKVKITLKNERN